MNQKGFTHIEVLMAAVVLSVVMVPALSGFLQAHRNFRYAYDYYRANLEAQNILEQGQILLSRKKDLTEYESRNDIFETISPEGLSVSDFEYALALYKISEGTVTDEVHIFESKDGLWQQEEIEFSTNSPDLFKSSPRPVTVPSPSALIFDLPAEVFDSYLTSASVYDKEGLLIKQMIKILTTV